MQLEREALRDAFLTRHGWSDAERRLLAADASFRTYDRLKKPDGSSAVFMNAPPPHEDVGPFVRTTHLLHHYGLYAPKLLAQDVVNGFLLLEDFGDARIAKVLQNEKSNELRLYTQAMDALIALYKQRKEVQHEGVRLYDEAEYLREVGLFTEWWLPKMMPEKQEAFTKKYLSVWKKLLKQIPLAEDVLVLRDFHADNLMACDDGRLGLLDYQDALMGDAAYDVVSLLEDARRDVSGQVVQDCLAYYVQQTGQKREDFMQCYYLLGAQRNLKILGIFMRLCLRDGKASYLAYMPRVWAHLQADLQHPSLKELSELMQEIPESLRIAPDVTGAAA